MSITKTFVTHCSSITGRTGDGTHYRHGRSIYSLIQLQLLSQRTINPSPFYDFSRIWPRESIFLGMLKVARKYLYDVIILLGITIEFYQDSCTK